MTGLPFVYAFWAGPAGALDAGDVAALQRRATPASPSPTRSRRDYFADDARAAGGRHALPAG